MGLLCRIFDDGLPFCHHCRYHYINGCPYGNHIHINMAALKALGIGNHQAVFNPYIRSQCPKPFDMLVNGAKADVTASRQGHLSPFILSQQCSQKIIGSPNLFHTIIINDHISDGPSGNPYGVSVNPLHQTPDIFNGLEHYIRIPDIRHIFYQYSLIRHDRSRKNSKGRIFGPANLHFSHQWITAFNCILFHSIPLYIYQNQLKFSSIFNINFTADRPPSIKTGSHIACHIRVHYTISPSFVNIKHQFR